MSITARIDGVTHIPPEFRAVILPPPVSVKIELTAACNFRCFFCATGKHLRHAGHMRRPLYERLAREIRAAGVEELGLFYLGESFLVPWLPDAIAFAKRECGFPYVFLTTNGALAVEARVEACMRAGLDSLKFSLNFADAAQCREITGADAFDAVLANLAAARKARDRVQAEMGHRCGLYASSVKYDGAQAARMAPLLERIAPLVDEHYTLPLYNQAGHISMDLAARGLRATAGNVGREEHRVKPLPCWAVFRGGHITFDGLLSACCFDHDQRFTMGDLTAQPFMTAWNSLAFQRLRRAHLAEDVRGTPCETCVAHA